MVRVCCLAKDIQLFKTELCRYVKSFIKLFAEDVKIIANVIKDRSVIDKDLKGLVLWGSTWLLDFNYDKCKVLHTDIIANKCFDYTLNDNYLTISEQEKDLGILTSNTLLWTDQISSSVSKANKLIISLLAYISDNKKFSN